ncbi:MAG: bifunctional chorismate mutase/prephenate dehydrogenase [Planctomycetes bacterium]|nr:bifunctional chorismate mutase/prephenate dehydrogenase [Planctomycetota bacterium]
MNSTNDGTSPNRPLAVLRAMIDAIDHDVLQLLARRTALVGEIAAYKREHGVRIRDAARERAILDDRCAQAERLGLPRDAVEAMYRLILLASRDHQAALRAELPLEVESRVVAIIGGAGAMGQCLARIFGDLGHAVMIADLETDLTPVEAARIADVVVISVPIPVTEAVIREVGPQVRPEALLMDVTSVKQGPMAAMLESTSASVVGTHPMFGPDVHSFQGQRVVLCPGRGAQWAKWLSRMFNARGLIVTEATPEQHDRVMAAVQVLTHFQTEVQGLVLSRLGVPLSETLAFTSPAYLLELYVIARHFAQDPELYGPIEMTNPLRDQVTTAFQAAGEHLAGVLAAGDQAAFAAVFDEVRRYFGSFTTEALEQSKFLIDRLVERS